MKFAVALVAFAASALAQHIEIGAPKNFAEVKAGSKITVEVDRPVRTHSLVFLSLHISISMFHFAHPGLLYARRTPSLG